MKVWPGMSKPYKWVIMALMVTLLILVLDYLGAVVLRYVRGDFTDQYYYSDNEIGLLHRHDVRIEVPWEESFAGSILYVTNNLGFREDAPTLEETKSTTRVIVFGDSHTDGVVDNEKSFSNVAEAILNRSATECTEIINAGVGYFSLHKELMLFKRLLYLSPDIAVFTVFIGNDYADIVVKPSDLSIFERWGKKSIILRLVSRLDMSPRMRAERVNRHAMWQGFLQSYYFKKHPGTFEQASSEHRATVKEITKVARMHNVDIVFILLPSKYQIEREEHVETYSVIEKILGFSPNQRVEDKVRSDLVSILLEESVPFIDPYDDFIRMKTSSETSLPASLYWNTDHHLSETGHRILGEFLASYFIKVFELGVEPRSDG